MKVTITLTPAQIDSIRRVLMSHLTGYIRPGHHLDTTLDVLVTILTKLPKPPKL